MAKKKSYCEIKPDEEWRVEDDLRTLTSAKEIRNDPKRMAKVRALAAKKLATIAPLAAEMAEGEGK
jgi:hypothetical protein